MKRLIVMFLVVFALTGSFSYADIDMGKFTQKEVILKEGENNIVLPGEFCKVEIDSGKNASFMLDYDKSALELTREETVYNDKVYYFKALSQVNVNTNVIIKAASGKTYSYKVMIAPLESIPVVQLREIEENPDKFINNFIMLDARFLGWARPKNTDTIWGDIVTRSDTVIEDETGAAYITGVNFMYKTRKSVKFIARVIPSAQAQHFSIELVRLLEEQE